MDQLLINCLNQEIDQESINYNMQTMFEKERYDRSSTIEKLVATRKFKYEKMIQIYSNNFSMMLKIQ